MLAILTTHPIQYQVPLWQALAEEGSVPFEVWYLTDHGTRPSYDQQFDKTFAWDLDTLSGYDYRFLKVNQSFNVNSFSKLWLAESLRTLIKKRGVTALWVQGWQVAAYWQAVWQAHASGISVWLRGESNDLASIPPLWRRLGKQFLLGQFFNRIRNFLYIGKANRRLYESYGIPAGQLYPAPYCVDNERFIKQSERIRSERLNIRRAWGIPEHAFCVLFAGKFVPKKRPFDLITAALDPRLRGRPIHLLFVGSGELGCGIRRACNVVFDAEPLNAGENGGSFNVAGPRASFVGFLNQAEISKAYVAADCLALPSDQRETWGLVTNEAMASGLPAIASDACGCSEDLISPINAKFRFPLGDTGAIAEAMLTLLNQPCQPSVLREQVEKFSIAATVETVKNLYASTAQHP